MSSRLKNTLISICAVIIAAVFGTLGYFMQGWINDNHDHTYKTTWTYDESYHWHACDSDICLSIIDKAEHIDEDTNGICDICYQGSTAIVNGVNYTSIQDAIDESTDKTVITLHKDIVSSGLKTEATKDIELDLNGHTLFITDPLVGSAGTKTLGFQFLKGSKVTIKNGTIKRVGPAKMLIQNYADLTLENVIIDAKSDTIEQDCYYVLSNNCGNVVIKGNTNIIADEGQVAFDLYYWPSGGYSEGVSVTFDETFTGYVEGKIEYSCDNTAEEGWESKCTLIIKGGTFNCEIIKSTDTANIQILDNVIFE